MAATTMIYHDFHYVEELGKKIIGLRYDKTSEFLEQYGESLLKTSQLDHSHNDVLERLAEQLFVTKYHFDEIWGLCNSFMDISIEDPLHPTYLKINGVSYIQNSSSLLSLERLANELSVQNLQVNMFFLQGMYNEIRSEAKGDERRGRKKLSSLLFNASQSLADGINILN